MTVYAPIDTAYHAIGCCDPNTQDKSHEVKRGVLTEISCTPACEKEIRRRFGFATQKQIVDPTPISADSLDWPEPDSKHRPNQFYDQKTHSHVIPLGGEHR